MNFALKRTLILLILAKTPAGREAGGRFAALALSDADGEGTARGSMTRVADLQRHSICSLLSSDGSESDSRTLVQRGRSEKGLVRHEMRDSPVRG